MMVHRRIKNNEWKGVRAKVVEAQAALNRARWMIENGTYIGDAIDQDERERRIEEGETLHEAITGIAHEIGELIPVIRLEQWETRHDGTAKLPIPKGTAPQPIKQPDDLT